MNMNEQLMKKPDGRSRNHPNFDADRLKAGLASPPAAITLTEQEQFVINAAECFEGNDLPEATDRDIDLLMDQPDQFRRDGETTEDRTRDRGLVSSIDPLKETTLGTDLDSMWLQDDETGQTVPLTAFAMEMTPPHVAMPSESVGSCAEQVVAPPPSRRRGRRGRQLVFVDLEVQVSDREMQEQIGNPQTETRPLQEVLLDLDSLTERPLPAQLFSAPCGSLLHPDLLLLWKQQASLTILPESGETQRAEGGSVQDLEILRTERKRRQSYMKETFGDSGLQSSEGPSELDVMQETFKEDKSGLDVMTSVSRGSPQDDIQPPMDPIAEETIDMPEAQTDMQNTNTLSWISSSLQEKVTFDSVLPPEADRATAAQILYKLLELLSAKHLRARQTAPYSDIILTPGAFRAAD